MIFRYWTAFVAWSLERFAERCARWGWVTEPNIFRSAAIDVRHLARADETYRSRKAR